MSSPSVAERRLQDAQLVYEGAVSDLKRAREDVEKARNDVDAASQEFNRARDELNLLREKFGAKADETMKNARTDMQNARTDMQNADQRMQNARNEVKNADERMDKADQRLKEARRAVKEEEEASENKKLRLENVTKRLKMDDYSLRLKRFAEAKIEDQCIVSEDYMPLPYNLEIQKVLVRKCYEQVFDLFVEAITITKETNSFGVSGTPGIGKSLFFLYILYRIMNDLPSRWEKPKRIIYQTGAAFVCYHLEEVEEKLAFVFIQSHVAAGLVLDKTTFYVIDGKDSLPFQSTCISLFICSPRSTHYTHYIEKRTAEQWFLPVWTEAELLDCRNKCYPWLLQDELEERFRIYGGVARVVFRNKAEKTPTRMDLALQNKKAVKGLRDIGMWSETFDASHTLMHMIIGDRKTTKRVGAKSVHVGLPYQFLYLDIASKYVGEQLWILHAETTIENISDIYGGSPSVMSGHLFEIYGHQVFSTGGFSLPCWSLDTNRICEDLKLDGGDRTYFRKDEILGLNLEQNHYYQPDDDQFPGIDSLRTQGMFQFTVASSHDIRGIQVLQNLCKKYKKPKLYFVVPKERFESFKKLGKQKVLYTRGSKEVKTDPPFEQYVLKLEVTLSQLKKNTQDDAE